MDQRVKKTNIAEWWQSSLLDGGNSAYLESLYESYLENPETVTDKWRAYFDDLPRVNGGDEVSHAPIREIYRYPEKQRIVGREPADTKQVLAHERKQVAVLQLINAHRFRAHQVADIDPLGLRDILDIPELGLAHYGLTESDLGTVFETGSLVGVEQARLRDILDQITTTYCRSIGSEYMHMTNTEEKRWIQNRLEKERCQPNFYLGTKRRILDRLIAAEGMERYLHTKYAGQKRFSLEGGESLIPCLDEIVQRGGESGIQELVVGMAHRGRLNVLVNILGKTPAELFKEFEGKANNNGGSGDVKYHQGFSSDIETPGGTLHLALAFNPSHLEIVGPVVEGSVRARQEKRGDREGREVVSVLIHGDAAFAGQGVIMETFNMSQSRGYSTKGTIHVVINNQIGFTTSNQQDARSSFYCTDVAKMVNAPIFHVNGDDPEAVIFVTRIAMDYRAKFQKDVVIDLVCYRRHGHSEADEPSATQPMMYQSIKQKLTTPAIYAQKLAEEGSISEQESQATVMAYGEAMAAGKNVALNKIKGAKSDYSFTSDWKPYLKQKTNSEVKTTSSLRRIRRLSRAINNVPEGVELHPSVAKILNNRRKMAAGAMPVDWGFAETMAYAVLLEKGFNVRLSGQDCGRGTFFHRHALLVNQKDGSSIIPLREAETSKGNFLVINSLLSEEAVLAFEYGYATTDPNTLTIWEAQFGDFANNAQVVIDQFISAGEQKWGRLCGLTMFLPHGYEGQGPEHSSARPERYLQLCAQNNIQVCMPTRAVHIYHLLMRQMIGRQRKPLIIMTPKSLLRHPLAASPLDDFAQGKFFEVMGDTAGLEGDKVQRVLFCSGKVYYDLWEQRKKDKRWDVAIMRIEQLYPFPKQALRGEVEKYPNAQRYIWVQEEPKNQGAWYSTQHHIRDVIRQRGYLEYAGRPMSAAPAVGYPSLHVQQLKDLIEDALGLPEE